MNEPRPRRSTGFLGLSPADNAKVNAALSAGIEGIHIGGHFYPAAPWGSSYCRNGCGAFMGTASSSAPEGIDPFGACPEAPGPI